MKVKRARPSGWKHGGNQPVWFRFMWKLLLRFQFIQLWTGSQKRPRTEHGSCLHTAGLREVKKARESALTKYVPHTRQALLGAIQVLSLLIHNHILKPACELIIITYMLKWKFELNARKLLRRAFWDFPGGPAVRTLSFHCRGRGFINPWSGC